MAQEPITSVPIPRWQITQLENLSGSGQLSGVDPTILALIDQAESSGEKAGAGVNSSGYGGYFGLGAGIQYPTGSVSRSTLMTNSQASFDQQAPVAAGEFASLLGQHGGNPYAAESAYQGGSTEGTDIFAAAGVPGNESGYVSGSGGSNTATLTANTSSSSLSGGWSPLSWLSGAFQPIIADVETFFVSMLFVVVGLILIIVAALYFILKGRSAGAAAVTKGIAA